MKRFISFTLALVLCFSLSIPALAAIDVSSMSVNELNELLGEIENQILKKAEMFKFLMVLISVVPTLPLEATISKL